MTPGFLMCFALQLSSSSVPPNSHTQPMPSGRVDSHVWGHTHARTHTHAHAHTHTHTYLPENNPYPSTAIGHLDCFHNFPLKILFQEMTNRNAVLLFLHRTSSVLFPPNKYEIKSLFFSFALFKAAFVVISSVHSVHLSLLPSILFLR